MHEPSEPRWGHRYRQVTETDPNQFGTALVAELDEIDLNAHLERMVHLATHVVSDPGGGLVYLAQIVTFTRYSGTEADSAPVTVPQ